MLNSVSDVARARLSPDDRRRQLLGIGLRMLVDKPIQDLSLDAVASEAGISRSLLFHYFPTKTDYYDAVVGAAVRRVLRNIAPDEDADSDAAGSVAPGGQRRHGRVAQPDREIRR